MTEDAKSGLTKYLERVLDETHSVRDEAVDFQNR